MTAAACTTPVARPRHPQRSDLVWLGIEAVTERVPEPDYPVAARVLVAVADDRMPCKRRCPQSRQQSARQGGQPVVIRCFRRGLWSGTTTDRPQNAARALAARSKHGPPSMEAGASPSPRGVSTSNSAATAGGTKRVRAA